MNDASGFCCAAWSYSSLWERLWCTLDWVPGVVPNPAAHVPLEPEKPTVAWELWLRCV